MLSLHNFISSVLGSTNSMSLLGAAKELGFDGAFSVLEFIAAAESGRGHFRPLPIESDGSGNYRADRLRIYFFEQGFPQISISSSINELGRLFPQIFNGFGDEVDDIEGIEQNIATTFYHSDRPFNDEPTLQFTLDARVIFSFINAPDIHDDWVGFVHQDTSSMAVQTLKRNFVQGNDVAFGIATAETLLAAGIAVGENIAGIPGALAGANPILSIGGGLTAGALNRYHFLAGRRSWKIGALPPIETTLGTARFFYLETAAIDRFSSWVIDLQTHLGNLGLGDIDQLTADLWIILLRNYVTFMGFDRNISGWENEITSVTPVQFAQRRRGVFLNQASFSSKQECLAQDWVQEIIDDHPGIAAQF